MTRSHTSARLPLPLRILHNHFFALLLASYVLAAAWPGPGLLLRAVDLAKIRLGGQSMNLTLPAVLLGLLLLNAGLGVRLAELRGLLKRPAPLVAGLLANLLIPIAFISGVAHTMTVWHNPDEVQVILVGLALVASMPIAGSSTAWAQNAEGDLALSLGMVVASTLLSPLATPWALRAVGGFTRGDYAAGLRDLAAHGSGLFLLVCVLLPTAAGILLRALLGDRRAAIIRPWLKTINALALLVLCYSNASAALPAALSQPDWDFLIAIVSVTGSLCVVAFASGWILGRLLGIEAAARTSLMFGLGMNNNGTGLVLASIALSSHPDVMLPVIAYNLIQQVVAASVGVWRGRVSARLS